VVWSPKHIGPSTLFLYFEFILKINIINIDSTRKISYCKINTLKVERIQNTFAKWFSPCILTLVYFHKRPAHAYSHWSIFTGNLPTHTHFGLFSGATSPRTLTLVYFHGRTAHTYSHWSIFTGDLPF
jgi:hypothetical protein